MQLGARGLRAMIKYFQRSFSSIAGVPNWGRLVAPPQAKWTLTLAPHSHPCRVWYMNGNYLVILVSVIVILPLALMRQLGGCGRVRPWRGCWRDTWESFTLIAILPLSQAI